MTETIRNSRLTEADADSMFVDRWSPRAMLTEPLSEHQIRMLFEAARWAPSCYNEQPWRFVYAVSPEGRARITEVLVERNRLWAGRAPLLMFILARTAFATRGTPNRHAPFDAGAAWMSLALQARRLGLYAHAMAGFDIGKAYELLGVSLDEFDILAAVAVGRHGDPDLLPDPLRDMEFPNSRKPLAEVATLLAG